MTVTTITGPGRVSQFIWGARQQHTLTLGYPAVLDNPRFWRQPQDGSELNQVNDGQDAWITTRDYMASFAVRWLSPQDWARFQLFLDWATVGGVFTFVPDAAGAPQFGLTGCVLVDPFDKPVPTPEANGYQALNITFRNPTQDLGLAWRGLMFEYAPGADTSPLGLNATFSRAGVAGFLNGAGLFESAASGALMDRHYPKGYSGGAPVLPRTTLLQPAAANKFTFPEDLSNGAWGKGDTTIPSTNNTSPRGDATASFLRENALNNFHYLSQAFTIAAAADTIGGTFFLKANGRTRMRVRLGDTAANWFDTIVDLAAGTIVANQGVGTGVVTFVDLRPAGSGWYVLQMYGKMGTGTAVTLQMFLQNGAGVDSYLGDGASGMYVWGCVATDNQVAGMYWGTGGSRAADAGPLFSFPYKPQALAIYDKFINNGTLWTYPARFFSIGAGGFGYVSLLAQNGAAQWRCEYGGATAYANALSTAGAAYGDTVELLVVIDSTGLVTMHQSVNGAAETVGTPNGPVGFALAFDVTKVSLLGLTDGTQLGLVAHQAVKVMPLTIGGLTIDTIAKARAL